MVFRCLVRSYINISHGYKGLEQVDSNAVRFTVGQFLLNFDCQVDRPRSLAGVLVLLDKLQHDRS